jgi:hypothetical protein
MPMSEKPKPAPRKPQPSGKAQEFFYEDDTGTRQDAALHQVILDEGDHAAALAIGRKVAKRLGLSDAQIDKLMRPKK